jgi:hypothetical protein
MLLGVTIPGDIIGPQLRLPPPLWAGFLWADRPEACRQSSIKSQQHTPDARYALLHKLDADLPARHSQAAALANPLARTRRRPLPRSEEASDLLF